MRRRTTAIACLVVALLMVFFFLAPVAYWMNVSPVAGGNMPLYRSLSCMAFGYGATYGPLGYSLSCQVLYLL